MIILKKILGVNDMGRIENNSKKKKYAVVIGILVVIIAGLIGYIILNSYSTNSKNDSSSSLESSAKVSTGTSTMSQTSEGSSFSSTTSNTENSDASIAVKNLSVEQRAALIILGAPSDWLFNGYPSQDTVNGTVREMAESDTNVIKLTRANRKLASNTSEEDQIFYVIGKDVQGVGGIPTRTYAFGRENNKIYYYLANTGVNSTPDTDNATSLGEANIDDIWKAYFNVGDLSEINKIANNIVIE